MIEIVPAILTDNAKEFKELAQRLVAAGVRRVHLDIADGAFVPMETITGYKELMESDIPLDWDIHLMVRRPEEFVDHWWGVPRADRFIMHVEATDDFAMLAKHVHGHDKHIGAAINPETSRSALEEVIGSVDLVQFMTVIPGGQGRKFRPEVLEHVKQIREDHPNIELAVDGGVTPDTASACVAAGANILVSGSYVVGSADPARAVQELQAAASTETEKRA